MGFLAEREREIMKMLKNGKPVHTANTIFNVIAIYVILRARSGAMYAVQDIMEDSIFPREPAKVYDAPIVIKQLWKKIS